MATNCVPLALGTKGCWQSTQVAESPEPEAYTHTEGSTQGFCDHTQTISTLGDRYEEQPSQNRVCVSLDSTWDFSEQGLVATALGNG